MTMEEEEEEEVTLTDMVCLTASYTSCSSGGRCLQVLLDISQYCITGNNNKDALLEMTHTIITISLKIPYTNK